MGFFGCHTLPHHHLNPRVFRKQLLQIAEKTTQSRGIDQPDGARFQALDYRGTPPKNHLSGEHLKPAEYEGGSFSISNLGMFGIEHFTAVINPPQAAILAVGGPVKQLHLDDGVAVETTHIRVTLSCDHRAIDGALGAQFLAALADYIENPILLSL